MIERRRDDDRLGRVEDTLDKIRDDIHEKDLKDDARLILMDERLTVLTLLVKDQSAATKDQLKEVKAEVQKIHETSLWFSTTWRVLLGIMGIVGVTIAILKATRIIP